MDYSPLFLFYIPCLAVPLLIGLMIVFTWDISMFTLQIMIILGKVSKTLKGNIGSNRDNNFQQNRFSVAWPQHTSQAKQNKT